MANATEKVNQGLAGMQAFVEMQTVILGEMRNESGRIAKQLQEGIDWATLNGKIDEKMQGNMGPWRANVENDLNQFATGIKTDLAQVKGGIENLANTAKAEVDQLKGNLAGELEQGKKDMQAEIQKVDVMVK